MTAIEAMIHCLEFVSNYPVDGEFQTQCVYDKYGYAHWIAWRVSQGKRAKPLLCSGSDVNPFAEMLEPYTAHRIEEAKCNCGASNDPGNPIPAQECGGPVGVKVVLEVM